MPSHPLNRFEIQKYYQNEPKFNSVCSRNNLTKTKDGALVSNLDEYELMKTHSIAFYVNDDNVTYFHSFRVEHIPKKIRKFITYKNVTIIEYKQMTQYCVNTFVLDLLTLC